MGDTDGQTSERTRCIDSQAFLLHVIFPEALCHTVHIVCW